MNRISTWLSIVFGYMFLALSFLVATETVMRKVFSASIQGADELGGYALAVGSSLAFAIALIGRSHIRIELIHQILPRRFQGFLNWLSAVAMGLFGVLLLWAGFIVVRDTLTYGSTAATPWMTPQVYPQGAWYASLGIFALLAIAMALRATFLMFTGRLDRLNTDFHPKGAMEELKEEMEDVKARAVGEGASSLDPTAATDRSK